MATCTIDMLDLVRWWLHEGMKDGGNGVLEMVIFVSVKIYNITGQLERGGKIEKENDNSSFNGMPLKNIFQRIIDFLQR
ncbi:hypothetical protein JHK87_050278 [Glycine soja]|nr:hypothetical protein JHK87_050278 [Glycine soja]